MKGLLIFFASIFIFNIVIQIIDSFKKTKPSKKWVNPDDAIANYIEAVSKPIDGIARKKSLLKNSTDEIFDCWLYYIDYNYKSLKELNKMEEALRLIYLQKYHFIDDDLSEKINNYHLNKFDFTATEEEYTNFLNQLNYKELNEDFEKLINEIKVYKK